MFGKAASNVYLDVFSLGVCTSADFPRSGFWVSRCARTESPDFRLQRLTMLLVDICQRSLVKEIGVLKRRGVGRKEVLCLGDEMRVESESGK